MWEPPIRLCGNLLSVYVETSYPTVEKPPIRQWRNLLSDSGGFPIRQWWFSLSDSGGFPIRQWWNPPIRQWWNLLSDSGGTSYPTVVVSLPDSGGFLTGQWCLATRAGVFSLPGTVYSQPGTVSNARDAADSH